MTTIDRALNSIGKKCFVDYYYQFKTCPNKQVLAQELLDNNPAASSQTAQITRINYAQWLFDNSLEKEALSIIIDSKRIDKETIRRAKTIRDSLR